MPDKPDDRYQQSIDIRAADLEARIQSLPHDWKLVSVVDMLMHRHCTDCGLPVVRHSPLGATFDVGTSNRHKCPLDPGEVVECQCGEPLLVFTSGRCVNFLGRDVHHCTYDHELGIYSHADPATRRVRAAPQGPVVPREPGVLALE